MTIEATYPNPIYHNLPPNKLTKGPFSFQKNLNIPKIQNLKDQNKCDDDSNGNSNIENFAQSSSISSSSSGDLINTQFEEYQKALHNRNKAIRDEFTVTKRLKRKVHDQSFKTKIIPNNIISTPKTTQTMTSQAPPKQSSLISQRPISSQNNINNQNNSNIQVANRNISALASNHPLNAINLTQTNGNRHSYFFSNFNSKSRHDPFNNSYIYNLDLNYNTNKSDPSLNVTGQSIVGASISYLRPQKISTFEEKKNINPTARLNWIKFRSNPVKKLKPYSPPISKEDQFLNKLMTKEGLEKARKKSEAMYLLRKQQKENQVIPDYANNTLCSSFEKATPNQKSKVISKTMALNDY